MNSFPTDRTHLQVMTLDFARNSCYRVCADPTLMAQWWGPDGFSNTIQDFDLRSGGSFRVTMHGPDGKDYPNQWSVELVVPGERIVLRHLDPHQHVHLFRIYIVFDDSEPGCTRLTWANVYDEAAEFERVRHFVIPANEQMIRRMLKVLQQMPTQT